jgi:hypothetical protein
MQELADRIDAHLLRLEGDPGFNLVHASTGTSRFYGARCWYFGGSYVAVRYVVYQGITNIRRADAESYLAGLDAGFQGNHFDWKLKKS